MGITIDTDMYLLCRMFNVSSGKLSGEYSGMSVEEIMKAEAKQGNKAAAQFDSAVLNDPVKLIELFKLKDPNNKFAILRNMNEDDLEALLPLLEQDDLATGLNFFTKDKILDMVEKMPIAQVAKYSLEMFSPEQIMQYMPEEQLDKALKSTDMNKNLEMKYLDTLPPDILAKMVQAATGEEAAGSQNVGLDGKPRYDGAQLSNQIKDLPDDKFNVAMLAIPTQHKRDFMLQISKDDPKVFLMFDAKAYTDIINQRKEKSDVVGAATVIDPKYLTKMIEQLPKDLTAVVLTQLDTNKFANILQSSFKNILSQIIAA